MNRLLTAIAFALFAAWASAAPFDDCEDMVKMGVPSKKGTPLCRTGYAASHDPVRKTPIWVAEYLTRAHAKGKLERASGFRPDPDLPVGQRAEKEDYKGKKYHQGHMSPAANNGWSEEAMKDSFLLSNAVPQNGSMNSGIWSQLEKRVRDWAIDRGSIYIFTGPVYARGIPIDRIGKNKVAVPSHIFKIVYDPDTEEAIAFMVENKKLSSSQMPNRIVKIEDIEKKTGLTFLTALSAAQRKAAVTSKASAVWQ